MALMFNRLAHNFIKNGYYPTDEATLSGIFSCIEVPVVSEDQRNPVIRIFDPCCGEGSALADAKRHLESKGAKVVAYGVEKDVERAAQAKEWLDVAVCSDAFDMRVGAGTFDLLFLNPPYGNVVADSGQTGNSKEKRFEELFCSTYFNSLRVGGLLVLIVPYYVLDGAIDTLIANQFDGVQVFQAPEQKFKQCVIFGLKKRNTSAMQKMATKDLLFSFKQAEKKPVLNAMGSVRTYELMPNGSENKEFVFVKVSIDDAQLGEEIARLHQASLWPQFEARFGVKHHRPPARPLSEPGNWHVALMLAAGQLQGVVRSVNGQTLLVKGNTYKTRIKEETVEEKSDGGFATVMTLTDKFNPVIKRINLTAGSPNFGDLLSIQ